MGRLTFSTAERNRDDKTDPVNCDKQTAVEFGDNSPDIDDHIVPIGIVINVIAVVVEVVYYLP